MESGQDKPIEQDEQDEQVIICSNCNCAMVWSIVTLYETRDTIDLAGRVDGLFVDIPALVCPVCENWY